MAETQPSVIDPKNAWESQAFKHDRQLLGCRISPCGKFVFAAAADQFVHRWNLADEIHTAIPGPTSWVGALAFHPDGKRLVTTDYVGGLRCWNYADAAPKPVWSVDGAHPNAIRALSVSSDGKHIATAGQDHIVRIWSAADGKRVHELTGHGSPIFCMAFHPDGKNLVSVEQHGVARHWDISTGKLVRTLDAGLLFADASLNGGARSCGPRGLAFDEAGDTLACTGLTKISDGDRRGGGATVVLFDWKTGKQTQLLEAKGAGYAERAVFHPAGFVVAACLTQERGTVQFWKSAGGDPVHNLKASCRDLDLHPDGKRFAVAEWERFGKSGNNASTEKLEEFQPNHGIVRIYTLTAKPPEAADEKKAK
jgi:WD40 repeat protein